MGYFLELAKGAVGCKADEAETQPEHTATCCDARTHRTFVPNLSPDVVPRGSPHTVESECWHCQTKGCCDCITCWNPATRGPGDCAVCKGTGKNSRWLQ
jgi:hypothetical protein